VITSLFNEERGPLVAPWILGSDRSRGYCLEMICADFLAGANLENGTLDVLFESVKKCLASDPYFIDELRQLSLAHGVHWQPR
jgi:hypothetical protein